MFDGGALAIVISAILTFILGVLTWVTNRGRSTADVRSEQQKMIDARVDSIMKADRERAESDRERIEKLETTADEQESEIGALKVKVREQDEEISGWRRRWGAVGRVFRALGSQWPGPDAPRLDPLDLADIEDTIPADWLRKPRPYQGEAP